MMDGLQRNRRLRGLVPILGLFVALAANATAQNTATAPDAFHVGDRLAVTIEGLPPSSSGYTTFSDTLVVRDGLVITLPTFGDISLAGVRRADAERFITSQVAKFVKDPVVHVVPMVRIAVLGEVAKPGFYSMPSDILLSDVVMLAGGPTTAADMSRTVVKRGSQDVISDKQVAAALTGGETLDDLRIAPGDQVVVGQKSSWNAGRFLAIGGLLLSLTTTLVYLSRR